MKQVSAIWRSSDRKACHSKERGDLRLPGPPLVALLEQHPVVVVRDVADLQPTDVVVPADVCRRLVAVVWLHRLVRDPIRDAVLRLLVAGLQDGVEAGTVRKYRVALRQVPLVIRFI